MKNSECQNFETSDLLSPELNLILCALQVAPAPGEGDCQIDQTGINWKQVTDLAIQHGVLPLVYRYLNKDMKGSFPATELSRQKNIWLNHMGRNIRITRKLLDLLKLLSSRGLTVIPFKGPVLAIQAHGDIGLRVFSDLDLLIKNRDFPGIYRVLESQGYEPMDRLSEKMKVVWKKIRRNFEFRKNTVFFDFHRKVVQGPRFLSITPDWNALDSVELLSQSVPSLNVEDTVLTLSLHGTQHGWAILKMVSDLAHLVHKHDGDIDWKRLITKAGQMGVLRMLLIGLMVSRQCCGLNISTEIQKLIEKDQKAVRLAEYFTQEVLKKEKSDFIPRMAIPRSLDSWFFKLRYMVFFLFNPTNLDVMAVRLPLFLFPLYYVIRPMRLLVNLIKGRELK